MSRLLKRLLVGLTAGLFAGLLVVVVLSWVWGCVPGSARYHIQETYSFRASDQDATLRVAVMIPRTGPYQQVTNVAISWDGTQTREPHDLLEVVKLVGQIKAHQEKAGTIRYDVVLHQGRAQWQGSTEDFQLQPQPGIESDAPAIVEAASRLVAGQGRDDAYRIYQFTAGRLSWRGRSGTDPSLRLQSALEAYQRREGVCGHFANLMTALCRAAKIPAQSISGLQLPGYPPGWSATGAAWGSPAGTHGWVEFHTPQGWEIADPSAAHWSPVKSLSFGRNDGGHLSFGERISQQRISEAMMIWAGAKGSLIGAMTGPLRFAAAADHNVSFWPRAAVKVTWSSRWLYLFVLATGLALLFAVWLLHRWRQRPRGSGPTKSPQWTAGLRCRFNRMSVARRR
jgi:hypothetical protein